MYVMYGEVNERHEVIRSEIAGLFPAGDTRDCENCSRLNWTIGHVLPVPSEIGASDGDLEEQYVLARFACRSMPSSTKTSRVHKGTEGSQGTVERPSEQLRDLRTRRCGVLEPEDFALGIIAPTVVMYPKEFVEALAEANGVYKGGAPKGCAWLASG